MDQFDQSAQYTTRAAIVSATALLKATSSTARRDAELLLLRVLGRDRAWMLSNPEALVTAEQAEQYQALLERRAQHEPMQYIVGEQEFYGLRFNVSPDVLIPRPETEHLVEAALAHISHDHRVSIADIGTGSGAIAVSLAHHRPHASVTALDLSQAALQIAQRNAEAHGVAGRIRFHHSDLLAALAGERFDMIVSNPPYVSDAEPLEAQVRDWEPAMALFAGADGLGIYRRLIPQAREALLRGGWLLLELGQGQRDALAALLADWREVSFVDDLQGIPRVALARR